MAEYQVTFWRDLPSLVVAREGDQVTKSPLAPRFQEAIDEAAMRLGEVGSDAYLEGWQRGPWSAADGAPADVAAGVAARLDAEFPDERLTAMLDALGSAQ